MSLILINLTKDIPWPFFAPPPIFVSTFSPTLEIPQETSMIPVADIGYLLRDTADAGILCTMQSAGVTQCVRLHLWRRWINDVPSRDYSSDFHPISEGWHSGASAISPCQRPRFDPDLECCVCVSVVYTFSLWSRSFPLGAQFPPTSQRCDGLQVNWHLVCRGWMWKWDDIELVWTGNRCSAWTQWAE